MQLTRKSVVGKSLVTSILNTAEKTCSGEIDGDAQIVEEVKREEGRVEGKKVVSKCRRRCLVFVEGVSKWTFTKKNLTS